MIKKKFWFILLLMAIFQMSTLSHNCFGQEDKYPRGAQYFLGTDDQLLIKVNIWGFVAKPGQYLVPSDTDLISLISFAGGPREGAKLNTIKLIRTMPNEKDEKVFKINVDKFTKKGDISIIPRLKPGDTIIISGSKWYYASKYLEFVSKLAMLVQIYTWINYYTTRD